MSECRQLHSGCRPGKPIKQRRSVTVPVDAKIADQPTTSYKNALAALFRKFYITQVPMRGADVLVKSRYLNIPDRYT